MTQLFGTSLKNVGMSCFEDTAHFCLTSLTLQRCSPFNSYSLLGQRTFKYLNAVNATFHLKCNKLGRTGVLFF
jgi:hypothetical protein